MADQQTALTAAQVAANAALAASNPITTPAYVGQAYNRGTGGGGNAQLVTYSSGTPANPPILTAAAWAYDPTGILPTLGWNTVTQLWK